MYPTLLGLHNILRWIALLAGFLVMIRAFLGWRNKRNWQTADRISSLIFTIAMDIQILLGMALFLFFSPITRLALADPGAAMRDGGLRFFAVEHTTLMLLALVFAHLASLLPRKAAPDSAKHRLALIWSSLALLMILLGMPWMRPLLPGL